VAKYVNGHTGILTPLNTVEELEVSLQLLVCGPANQPLDRIRSVKALLYDDYRLELITALSKLLTLIEDGRYPALKRLTFCVVDQSAYVAPRESVIRTMDQVAELTISQSSLHFNERCSTLGIQTGLGDNLHLMFDMKRARARKESHA
jgi:hypothetical protein